MADIVLNGHTYNAAMMTANGGYGYRDTNADTGLPNFPESIFTDFLAELEPVQTALADQTAATAACEAATEAAEAALRVAVNAQAGVTYTLVLGDAGKLVTLTNGSAITLTVPADADVAWPVGEAVMIQQTGAGQVTVAGAGGVTVNGTGTRPRAQWSAAVLLKTGTDTWTLIGDIV